MYHGRFLLVNALLVVVAAAAVCAGIYKIALQDTRTVTRTRPAPGLTAKSTVAHVEARYTQQAQAVDGEQLGLPAGTACEAYELADGIVLVCHQGGG